MKLSVVVICWNDADCILDCLRSISAQSASVSSETIVVDNGSTDDSIARVRNEFPQVRIVENERNLGFGPGNNAGFHLAQGDYILILNPDTLVHEDALAKLIGYADRHPEAGAFGCRVLNTDGSLQFTAQPAPTVFRYLIGALFLRPLGRVSNLFVSDVYAGWDGRSEKTIGFQAGCCLMVRGQLLKALGGFDPIFFHQFEDADLCHRVWQSGSSVLFYPGAEITHIGGRNRGGYPIGVLLETERSKCRYFHKHYGFRGLARIRFVAILGLALRFFGYGLVNLFRGDKELQKRVDAFKVLLTWYWRLRPVQFIETGSEPDVGYAPLFYPPKLNGTCYQKAERV